MNTSAHKDTFARDNLPPPEQWPEFVFSLPELHYPPRLNCVAELLDRTVAAKGGAEGAAAAGPAIHHAGGVWSYAKLQGQVNRIAQVLLEDMKLVPGNRVLLRGANNPMMAACILAVIKAGCIAVPTMPMLRAKELATIIGKARINAALCAASLAGELDLALAPSPAAARESVLESPQSVKESPQSADRQSDRQSGQQSDRPSDRQVGGGGPLPVLTFGMDGSSPLESAMAAKSGLFDAVDTAADDVCLISFTSGTTGTPKGTMHFHRDLLAICDCFPRSTLRSQQDDVFIGTPPLAFTFGLGGLLLFPLRVGAATVLLEKLSPDLLLQAVQDFAASICFTAPTMYRQMALLAGQYRLASLKKTVSAGEALPLPTREAWQRATGLALIDGIGATEMLHIFISAADGDIRPGATGKPIPGYQACILDADGKPAGPGVVGRLAVKGPTGCRYLDDPRQCQYVLDGWNLTGDAYEMDADGYFFYRSRTDDMIISSGYNIAGPEVEDALLTHPAVAECGVVGCADEDRGQIVKAFVVLKQGFAPGPEMVKTLQDFVKQRIAPYKYPRAIAFQDALPRTETGKLQRFKLRQGA